MNANRPHVIVGVFSSIDGRLTTAPGRNVAEWTAAGIDGGANDLAHRLFDDLDCDGLLSGSETFFAWGGHPVDLPEPIYWPKKSKAFIAFDGRGRVDWAYTDGLLVVTRADVHPGYLEQLRRKNVEYILAGRGEQIDLADALAQLHARGFRRLGLSGGGGINGAFLRAGLVDEISLLIAPVAVGGRQTPTVFDAPDLPGLAGVTRLELLAAKPLGDQGAVWLHYQVQR